MDYVQSLLVGLFAFQAVVLAAWLLYVRREVKEERRKFIKTFEAAGICCIRKNKLQFLGWHVMSAIILI